MQRYNNFIDLLKNNNINFRDELDKDATCAKIALAQTEGNRMVTREVAYYNLDVIISVGYRVNFVNATKFSQWAMFSDIFLAYCGIFII